MRLPVDDACHFENAKGTFFQKCEISGSNEVATFGESNRAILNSATSSRKQCVITRKSNPSQRRGNFARINFWKIIAITWLLSKETDILF